MSKNVKSGPKIDHMHTKRDINNKHFGVVLIVTTLDKNELLLVLFRIMYYASCYTEIMVLWTIYTEIYSTHVSIFHCMFITLSQLEET